MDRLGQPVQETPKRKRGIDPSTRFSLVSKLGKGSYGEVWKAIDTLDNTEVAVKIIRDVDFDSVELKREMSVLKELSQHPHIVTSRGTYLHNEDGWIAMEYCEAGSIHELMSAAHRPLSEEDISVVVRSVLSALEHLHKHKRIHRDIKSGNVLVTKGGVCKLADFGVSATLANTNANRNTMTGTPYWMAPELLIGKAYNSKVDIWSLGIMCIEMATRDVPLSHLDPMKAMRVIPTADEPRLPREGRWSVEFQDLVAHMLVKSPERRSTATELLQHPFVQKHASKDLKPLVFVRLPLVLAARKGADIRVAPAPQPRRDAHSAPDVQGPVETIALTQEMQTGDFDDEKGAPMDSGTCIDITDPKSITRDPDYPRILQELGVSEESTFLQVMNKIIELDRANMMTMPGSPEYVVFIKKREVLKHLCERHGK